MWRASETASATLAAINTMTQFGSDAVGTRRTREE